MLNHVGPVYYEQGCLKQVDYINTLVHCVQGQLDLDGCICEGIGISIRIMKYGRTEKSDQRESNKNTKKTSIVQSEQTKGKQFEV